MKTHTIEDFWAFSNHEVVAAGPARTVHGLRRRAPLHQCIALAKKHKFSSGARVSGHSSLEFQPRIG